MVFSRHVRDAVLRALMRRLDWVNQLVIMANEPHAHYNRFASIELYAEMLRVEDGIRQRRALISKGA